MNKKLLPMILSLYYFFTSTSHNRAMENKSDACAGIKYLNQTVTEHNKLMGEKLQKIEPYYRMQLLLETESPEAINNLLLVIHHFSLLNFNENYNETPFIVHAIDKNWPMKSLELIIHFGATVNCVGEEIFPLSKPLKKTPLLTAIDKGKKKCIRLLLIHGAYLDDQNALQKAAQHVMNLPTNLRINKKLLKETSEAKRLVECLKFQNTNFRNPETRQHHLERVTVILMGHPQFDSIQALQSYSADLEGFQLI